MLRLNNSSTRLVRTLALVAALALLVPPVSFNTQSEERAGELSAARGFAQDQESFAGAMREDDSDEEEDFDRAGERRSDPCLRRRGRDVRLRRRCQGGSSSGVAKGDFNGDGFGDLAIGVPFEEVNGQISAGAVVSSRSGCECIKVMLLTTLLLICGAYSYVAPSFDWQLALAYGPLRRHITFRGQSVRRNDISPLSSAHLLVRVVSFTSQVASALAFISRSISA